MKMKLNSKLMLTILTLTMLVGCKKVVLEEPIVDEPVIEDEFVVDEFSEGEQFEDDLESSDDTNTTEEVLDITADVAKETKDNLAVLGKLALGGLKNTAKDVDKYMQDNNVPERMRAQIEEKLGMIDSKVNEYKEGNSVQTEISSNWVNETIEAYGLQDHKEIQVDGGDTSGQRQPNVRVNIGFGDRVYWAFTNSHGQLTHVIAEEIVVQNDDTEPVNSNGRYYSRMADVPGTENSKYDRGHVIADSLGGVANAYNITPQEAYLNRHGDQAYMESVMRKAGGAQGLIATIDYPDTSTQTPTGYNFSYTIRGTQVNDSFLNEDPR